MVIVALLRYYLTKMMNAPDNVLLKKANMSFESLKKTLFEVDADMNKEVGQDAIDLSKVLTNVKEDVKDK